MKKAVSLLMIIVMLLVAVPVAVAAVPSGYTAISSQAGLQAIANNLSGKYMLTADITLSGTMAPIGSAETPFTGILDGDGYTIKDLTVEVQSDDTTLAGLFANNAGTIKNLNIADASIVGEGTDFYATTYTYVGGIAGINSGTIENCTISGSVTGSSSSLTAYVGGIVGENTGTISKCACRATVEVVATSEAAAGGIAGWNKATVTNCYNTANVTGTVNAEDTVVRVGGIAGKNGFAGNGTISYCHNKGAVSATEGERYVGGIAGQNLKTITTCYYLSTVASSQAGNSTATTGAISSASYKRKASFSGFDFTNVWTIDNYPTLIGQPVEEEPDPEPEPVVPTGDVNGDNTVNLADVLYLMSYCNQHTGVTVSLETGDLNGDGVIDILDVIRLMKNIAG